MSSNQPWCTQNGRKNNFDFFRFLLANLVIFSHCYPLLYGEAYGNTIEPFMPVSYTHLDVYKRQKQHLLSILLTRCTFQL